MPIYEGGDLLGGSIKGWWFIGITKVFRGLDTNGYPHLSSFPLTVPFNSG